jgi:hypothetical protein
MAGAIVIKSYDLCDSLSIKNHNEYLLINEKAASIGLFRGINSGVANR